MNATKKEKKLEDKRAQYRKFFRDSDIENSYRACMRLLDTGIFNSQNVESPLYEAAVTQILVCLSDLVQKADADGYRITILDHVDINEDVKDVTDLITRSRNAACHISSPLQEIDTSRFRFCVAVGKCTAIQFGDFAMGCEFDDDIAVWYGRYRIYLKRHVVTVLNRLSEIYPAVRR